MRRYRSKRNYGYGRRLDYAGKRVLRDRYGGGHYATVYDGHVPRWMHFARWCIRIGIKDMRRITEEIVVSYIVFCAVNGDAVSTLHNRVSTINVVLGHASRGRWKRLSPTGIVGEKRCHVRKTVPASLDDGKVWRAVKLLCEAELERVAAVLLLCRYFGLRVREAVLADLERWRREAERFGRVNVLDGTKGGRKADRWIHMSKERWVVLRFAISVKPEGSHRLIAPDERYEDWRHRLLPRGREVLKSCGIKDYRDHRAAYACERYSEEADADAPVVAGGRVADRSKHRAASGQVAYEMGHSRNRTDVLGHYYGTGRAKSRETGHERD